MICQILFIYVIDRGVALQQGVNNLFILMQGPLLTFMKSTGFSQCLGSTQVIDGFFSGLLQECRMKAVGPLESWICNLYIYI